MTWIVTYKADRIWRKGGAVHERGTGTGTKLVDDFLEAWLRREQQYASTIRKGGDGEAIENIVVLFAVKDSR